MLSPPPIIIKKKLRHGGAWKVAYFVTATMAIALHRAVADQEAVGGYFKNPTGTANKVGTDLKGASENFFVSKDNMKELKEQLQKPIKQVPKFNELQNHIAMTVTNEGLRIELTESSKGSFLPK
jgi:chemotaxis protein MotB